MAEELLVCRVCGQDGEDVVVGECVVGDHTVVLDRRARVVELCPLERADVDDILVVGGILAQGHGPHRQEHRLILKDDQGKAFENFDRADVLLDAQFEYQGLSEYVLTNGVILGGNSPDFEAVADDDEVVCEESLLAQGVDFRVLEEVLGLELVARGGEPLC